MRPFHYQRPLTAAAAFWGLGIGMGIFMPWKPAFSLVGLLIALLLCALLHHSGRRMLPGLLMACFFAALLEAGIVSHPVLPPEGDYRVTAIAAEDFTLRENGRCAGYLEGVRLQSGDAVFTQNRVYWSFMPKEDTPLPREGDSLSFTASLYAPQSRVNPFGFDRRLYYLEKGVSVCLSGAGEYAQSGHPGRGLASFFYQARKRASERLRLLFGADSALPEAMLLGEKEELPEDTQTAFTRAGVAHLLSISGLHVSLLAGAIDEILKRLMGYKKRSVFITVLLLFYCALLEFSMPALRAVLFFALVKAARFRRRPTDGITTLSASFLLLTALSPLSLVSAGFQLSFCAVLGIALWQKPLEKHFSFLPDRFSVRSSVTVTFSASLGVFLPAVLYFHRFSLLGFLLSPLLCAVFLFLLPLYALVLLLGAVLLPLGQALAIPVGLASRGIANALKACAAWPFAQITLPSPPVYTAVGLVFALLVLCRLCALEKRKKRALALSAAVLSFCLWGVFLERDVQYIQFSMGQADAAAITDGRQTVLIDTGEYGSDLSDYLLSTGRKADIVVLTHLHADHCLGLESLIEEGIRIGHVYLPEGAEETAADELCFTLLEKLRALRIPVSFLHAGDTLQTPRTSLTVLWPQAGRTHPGGDANHYSLAALIDLDGVKLLHAGDLTGAYERYAQADADILKIAHHGSNDSTGADFLSAVSPRYALVTGNGYGALPGADTLSRLAEAGVLVYNTGESGALTLTARAGQCTLTPFLAKEPEQHP